MAELRVKGLVSLMRVARKRASVGLTPAQAGTLRQEIERELATVHKIFRETGCSAEDLPVPSRRAYRFLESFDPQSTPKGGGRLQRYSLPGLAVSARDFLNRMVCAASPAQQERVIGLITAWIREAEERLEVVAGGAAALSEKQQRQLARLHFYSEVDTVRLFADNAAKFTDVLRKQWPKRIFCPSIPLVYWDAGGSRLWSLKQESGASVLRCSDIFLLDPEGRSPRLLGVAVASAASGRRNNGALRDWARSEVVQSFEKRLEEAVTRDRDAARGVRFDLRALFDALNNSYFAGELQPGPLEWGARRAHSRTGTYDPATGGIRLSPVLDDPDVPWYVVEFVLYHEMLHLAQDAAGELRPGRRVHTKRFQELERRYPRWREAEAFLKCLASRA